MLKYILLFMIISTLFAIFYEIYKYKRCIDIAVFSTIISGVLSLFFLNNINTTFNGSTVHFLKIFDINSYTVYFSHKNDFLSYIWYTTVSLLNTFTCFYAKYHIKEELGKLIALLNLFAISMLIFVASDNLFQMYFGWELITIISYFLINFYYKTHKTYKTIAFNILSLHKFGDICFLLGIILICAYYNTLDIKPIILGRRIMDCEVANISAVLMLIAISIKSAQLGFMGWLKNAMIAPTPASAFLHTATLVSAGAFLLIRIQQMFEINIHIKHIYFYYCLFSSSISILAAFKQKNIKCVLAYLTISEIGLILSSIILGDFKFASSLFIVHSFAKVALFFGVGNIIAALDGEKNLYHMGGLLNKLPKTYTAILFSALLLSGIIPNFIESNKLLDCDIHFLYIISFFKIGALTRLIHLIFYKKNKSDCPVVEIYEAEKRPISFILFALILINLAIRISFFFSAQEVHYLSEISTFMIKLSFTAFFVLICSSKYFSYIDRTLISQKWDYWIKTNLLKDSTNTRDLSYYLDTLFFKKIYDISYAFLKNASYVNHKLDINLVGINIFFVLIAAYILFYF